MNPWTLPRCLTTRLDCFYHLSVIKCWAGLSHLNSTEVNTYLQVISLYRSKFGKAMVVICFNNNSYDNEEVFQDKIQLEFLPFTVQVTFGYYNSACHFKAAVLYQLPHGSRNLSESMCCSGIDPIEKVWAEVGWKVVEVKCVHSFDNI